MSGDLNEREAKRRVDAACDLIRSAYRLHTLYPQDTLVKVKSAIAWGVQDQAEDIRQDVAAGGGTDG